MSAQLFLIDFANMHVIAAQHDTRAFQAPKLGLKPETPKASGFAPEEFPNVTLSFLEFRIETTAATSATLFSASTATIVLLVLFLPLILFLRIISPCFTTIRVMLLLVLVLRAAPGCEC